MLSIIIYNIAIRLYKAGLALAAAAGHQKARLWLRGRQGWQAKMQQQLAGAGSLIWVHAASLGEFEQGRPVLEALRKQYPGYRILLSFFSPSGYEVRKDYKGADYVYYLPLDTRRNACQWLDIADPQLVIFIKYEFWYHFMTALYERQVPVLLISGIFRRDQPFFKPYGGLFRQLLRQLTHIFVQNKASQQCLRQINITHVTVAGDTRFDRVWALRQEAVEQPLIAQFCGDRKTVVAGSTWDSDEKALYHWWAGHEQEGRCLIIAPHEIGEDHIKRLQALFRGALRYSALPGLTLRHNDSQVLIIDNVGMLSSLYRYAHIAYIGGGFDKEGIHNILEPATYGKPVIFGPVYDKFAEAEQLLALGGAFAVPHDAGLAAQLEHLLHDNEACAQTGAVAGQYVTDHKGATDRILAYIQEKRFLTSE